MEIVLASRNNKKIAELQALMSEILPEIKVLSLDDIGFCGDIIEDGESFEENAMIKAKAVAERGYIGVGDDSGLSVNALGGAPGIYSARYAGEHGDDEANNQKLLSELEGKSDRSGAFVSVVACAMPDGECFSVRGECPGIILTEYKGNGGFGYDPLFYYEALGKTFAELSMAEKNEISHRGRAMRAFAYEFAKRI
ncbi:MAG: RdgB/HAM1 family non-canonical purine NTP pyrophosphatase [Clostridia bacterium]|nr:RdgB/HAM1 family non-canonical purine NTP pyrophosphatase [Clostridia bacterium]MBR6603585.1 RdgB/HAM1 family non-canonical purine NTP pyrophosphatase [Clostridia bacterium]